VYIVLLKDFNKSLDMIDGKIHGTDCFEVDSVSFKNFLNFIQVYKIIQRTLQIVTCFDSIPDKNKPSKVSSLA